MKIKLDIHDKEYTLYYTRDAMVRMEKEGLDVTKMDSQVVTTLRLLFWGAMLPLNPRLSLDKADSLLDVVLNEYDLSELFEALIELFNDAFPKSDGKGKKKLVRVK